MSQPNLTYDDPAIVITVDADTLTRALNTVQSVVDEVVKSVELINSTLAELKLSWVGTSSAQATLFQNQWNAAMLRLFGQNNDPGWGTVNQLVAAVATAVGNYSSVEGALHSDFVNLLTALSSQSSGPDNSSQPNPPIQELY
jgi:hypothetical protein